jgi:hypothetical protein
VSLRILWNYPALVTFHSLRIHEATAIDRAVIRFSETGEGRLTWVAPYHRLRAGAFDAVLSIQREARVMTVLRIYRAPRA